MSDNEISRRQLLVGGALMGAACMTGAKGPQEGASASSPTIKGAVPWREGTADAPTMAEGTDYRFFTPAERPFIEAAIDRLIPPDENGPSATQANVHVFLDRQLGGAFGTGRAFLSRRAVA